MPAPLAAQVGRSHDAVQGAAQVPVGGVEQAHARTVGATLDRTPDGADGPGRVAAEALDVRGCAQVVDQSALEV